MPLLQHGVVPVHVHRAQRGPVVEGQFEVRGGAADDEVAPLDAGASSWVRRSTSIRSGPRAAVHSLPSSAERRDEDPSTSGSASSRVVEQDVEDLVDARRPPARRGPACRSPWRPGRRSGARPVRGRNAGRRTRPSGRPRTRSTPGWPPGSPRAGRSGRRRRWRPREPGRRRREGRAAASSDGRSPRTARGSRTRRTGRRGRPGHGPPSPRRSGPRRPSPHFRGRTSVRLTRPAPRQSGRSGPRIHGSLPAHPGRSVRAVAAALAPSVSPGVSVRRWPPVAGRSP